jgi:hypothetical protein
LGTGNCRKDRDSEKHKYAVFKNAPINHFHFFDHQFLRVKYEIVHDKNLPVRENFAQGLFHFLL